MLTIEWKQHPVGHGGFHVGQACLDNEPPSFTWVFDCGSRSSTKFRTYLDEWLSRRPELPSGQKEPIDWLFLSHFDQDHVSGLDYLMSRLQVKNVMVPYVNNSELVISLLEGRKPDGWFINLVANPASWLLEHGAGQVFFLQGSLDGPPPR